MYLNRTINSNFFSFQLEKCIDDATRKHDFQALEQFLETDFSDGISHKCSKQFLNKVDKLMCQVKWISFSCFCFVPIGGV